MAKVKEITVGGSYTWQPVSYHAIRGELNFTIELEDGDDIEQVQAEARGDITKGIVMMLAEIDDVHSKLNRGQRPEDLIAEDSDMLPMDDDDDIDWDE